MLLIGHQRSSPKEEITKQRSWLVQLLGCGTATWASSTSTCHQGHCTWYIMTRVVYPQFANWNEGISGQASCQTYLALLLKAPQKKEENILYVLIYTYIIYYPHHWSSLHPQRSTSCNCTSVSAKVSTWQEPANQPALMCCHLHICSPLEWKARKKTLTGHTHKQVLRSYDS